MLPASRIRLIVLIGASVLPSARFANAQERIWEPLLPGLSLPPGGLIVHLGTTDGEREINLAKGGQFIVHGLTEHANNVAGVRSRFAKAKVAGQAQVQAVKTWKSLPYP